jgi:hypothetical protein
MKISNQLQSDLIGYALLLVLVSPFLIWWAMQ